MIRKTLAATVVAGVALTGAAQTAHAAPAKSKTRTYEACGKGQTAKNGKCVKGAKQKVSGKVRFTSAVGVYGKAVNKTRSTMDVKVDIYWRTPAGENRHIGRTFPVKAGKTYEMATGAPISLRLMQKVTVQICSGPKTKRECGIKKTIRP